MKKKINLLVLTLLGALASWLVPAASAADYTISDAVAQGNTALSSVNTFITSGASIKFAILGLSIVIGLVYWALKRK